MKKFKRFKRNKKPTLLECLFVAFVIAQCKEELNIQIQKMIETGELKVKI